MSKGSAAVLFVTLRPSCNVRRWSIPSLLPDLLVAVACGFSYRVCWLAVGCAFHLSPELYFISDPSAVADWGASDLRLPRRRAGGRNGVYQV